MHRVVHREAFWQAPEKQRHPVQLRGSCNAWQQIKSVVLENRPWYVRETAVRSTDSAGDFILGQLRA